MSDIMLTNDYSGSGLHLDTYSDTKQGFLGGGDHSGQHWVLERVEKLDGVREVCGFDGGVSLCRWFFLFFCVGGL